MGFGKNELNLLERLLMMTKIKTQVKQIQIMTEFALQSIYY